MRRFVIVGHKAITDANFKLNDMAGGAGRLDVLLRCINSAFFLSHDLRRDVEIYLVLTGPPDPPKTIKMVGSELRYLNPDERSTGALVRNALLKKIPDEGGVVRSSPGIYISRQGFEEVIDSLAETSSIMYLHENGRDINDMELPEGDICFVLGDHMDLTEEEEKILAKHSPLRVSLGPEILHADHCIVLVQNVLDRGRCK